jgi:signal transduction histidine kinase/ligand-binding sensor domain-containing protein/DNA-binding response OmpR family regulator
LKPVLPIFLALFLAASGQLHAQLKMESLTVADGLSQGFVTCMIQDHKGFLWIGTYDGLNRYDGYSVKQFKPRPFDSLSIQTSYITYLHEDPQHFLWVGTASGLYLFDPLKERFYNLSTSTLSIPALFIESLNGDKFGNVMVRQFAQEDQSAVRVLQLPPDFSRVLATNPQPLSTIRQKSLPIRFPHVGKLLLHGCINDSLFLLRDEQDNFFRVFPESGIIEPFQLQQLPGGNRIDQNTLWLNSIGSIFRQPGVGGTAKLIPPEQWPLALRVANNRIGLWFFDTGAFFVGSDTAHVPVDLLRPERELLQDPAFKKTFTALIDGPPQGISWNHQLMVDRGGLLWLSTGGWGIRKINPRQIAFNKHLAGRSISSIREFRDGRLWIRFFDDQYVVLNPATGLTEPAPWEAKVGKNCFYEIFPDSKNRYWLIETQLKKSKLRLFDANTQELYDFPEHIPYLHAVLDKILEDRAGNIWIGSCNGTLYRCQPGKKTLDDFNYGNMLPKDIITNLRTTALFQDAGGALWVGTNYGLLRLDNPDSPQFTVFNYHPNKTGTLSNDWITTICQDPQQNDVFWLGTRGGGLNRFQRSSQTFTYWSEAPNGMPDNVVYGILPDDVGNLWCSTNKGIFRYTPATNTFVSYLESDGLLSTEFNTNSYLRSRDGKLWFGGVNGLNVFHPEEILPRNSTPQVAITGIKVRGVQRFPDKEGLLILDFSENNVLFEFATLDFANPATNRFRHRLRGLERAWVEDGTQHIANYAALPPGRYTFELQGATADGFWSDQILVFTLIIRPPWYRTWLAYLIYVSVFCSAIFGYIRYREHVLKLENAASMNQQESARLKAFEQLKNQFFTNVAHELRTPLTVILGLADRIKKGEDSAEHAAQITRQGEQLLYLANQVLDLSKLEHNHFQLHLEKGNILAFVRNHAQALNPLAASKGIALEVQTHPRELWMDFDLPQLQKILNNLIANAVRHTPPGGKIQVSAAVEPNQDWLHIQVSDTGEGISEADLPHIFDRFFQSAKTQSAVGASGIGLTLTRDLVLHMGGRISVESTPGHGTTFSIHLPVPDITAQIPQNTPPEAAPLPVLPVAPNNAHLPLLLVLEDNVDVWHFLHISLKSHFRLIHADNGEAGIVKALEHIPDIVLTDVAMPQKNGYEVTSILKQDPRTSHIPIAMLTAKVETADRMEGRRRGANAYLTKPFDINELLLVLHNLLDLQKMWQARYTSRQAEPLPTDALAVEDVAVEDQFMQQLYQIFENNYTDDTFNLEKLCRLLGISSSQLDRKIKALTSHSPMLLLRTFRLKKAKELLQQQPKTSIKEVCFRTGFKNPAHFSRLYSKEFGAPPSAG